MTVNIEDLKAQIAAAASAKKMEADAVAAARATRAEEGWSIAEAVAPDADVSESRAVSLSIAAEAGADAVTLAKLAAACRLCRGDHIYLPHGEYLRLMRGRDWCRPAGMRDAFLPPDDAGYRIDEPGEYEVGSTDGFRRRSKVQWKVAQVKVGTEVWTIAD